MAEKMKTLKEVSKVTGISVSTVRKYLNEFSGLIPTEKGTRNSLMFGSEAIKKIEIIRDMYQDRATKTDIVAKLQGTPKSAQNTAEESAPMTIGKVDHDEQDPRFW